MDWWVLDFLSVEIFLLQFIKNQVIKSLFDPTFLLPISKTMLYITRVNILMVNGKISKSSLNKPSHKCRLKNVPQFNYSTNFWFFSTVTDAKWVFMLLKYYNLKLGLKEKINLVIKISPKLSQKGSLHIKLMWILRKYTWTA